MIFYYLRKFFFMKEKGKIALQRFVSVRFEALLRFISNLSTAEYFLKF